MEFLRFLISKVFLKNLFYAIVFFVFIVLGTLLWLHLYTHHGMARPVPDFTGKTLEEIECVVGGAGPRHQRQIRRRAT